MVPTSHMMVPTITLLGTINFYLLFKLNIYKKSDYTNITLETLHMIIFISHLMISIEWILYPQKEWIL